MAAGGHSSFPIAMSYAGTLEILAVEGKGLKDKEIFSKQDPYLKLILDGAQVRTKTHHNGGKNPTWNQTVHLYSIFDVETSFLALLC